MKRPSATTTVLGLLCVMYLITYIDRVNIATAGPAIQKELGLSTTELAHIFSAFGYPYLLFQIFGGWIGDRAGARRTLFLCGLIWAAATMLTGLVATATTLFLVRVLLGVGEGATFPVATRAMQNWTPGGRRGFAQGITHAFARFGNAATPPLVAGVAGDLLGGTVSDAVLKRTGNVRVARLSVIVFGFVCSGVCVLPMFATHDLTLIVLSLAAGFFFAELVIGPIWAIPMDIAPE